MDNGNFWDWDNQDEHRVSSVYRDADVETVKAQGNVSQNNIEQSVNSQSNVVSNNIEQDTKEENVVLQTNAVQNVEVQEDVIQNIIQDKIQNVSDTQTSVAPPEAVTENNFILVDNPQDTTQNITPQAETSYAQAEHQQTDYQQTAYRQTEHQQNNFQQIIPIQNTQQNQGTNSQNAKQNKNTDYSANFNPKDISENKVSAMAAYLLGPVGIIIALLIARDSAYTAFHVRQALKITICSVVLEIIAAVLALFAMIPLVGIIFKLVLIIISAIWFGVLMIRLIAIAQVCDGEAREPAVIGKMNCFH